MISLDHPATTPLRPEVFEAMRPFLTERGGNPSSSYAFGSSLQSVIEAARGHGGALLGASAREIVFTGIESEALLLLLDQAGICASAGSACLRLPRRFRRALPRRPRNEAGECRLAPNGAVFTGERNDDGRNRRRRRRRERDRQPIESLLTEWLFLTAEK